MSPPSDTIRLLQAGRYAFAAAAVAEELGMPCVNLWEEMQQARPNDKWHSFLSDGLHFSAEGNPFLGELLLKKIANTCPSLAVHPCPITGSFGNSSSVSEIEQHGPWHDEIDCKDFSAAFQSS
ncbi:unnamed protein product [Polarella glacialis]|uniref:SGNH hydrolase-type esterase domain-containing protein n=1 Tax=Polarella glacialis TaxID=89957 RepID=A0A813HTG5_POLGL|nr:unnamed protein product [Polarella glacialis]